MLPSCYACHLPYAIIGKPRLDEVKGIFVVVDIYLRGRHYVFINTVGANAKVQTL
jgi:hypothetical protein